MEDEFVSEEQPEWQQVQSPFSAKLISNDEGLVAIKDDFYGELSGFPPGDHEDLPATAPEEPDDNQQLQEPEPVVRLPSPSEPTDGYWRSKRLQLVAIQNGISRIVDRVRKSIAWKAGYLQVALTAGGVAAALLVLYMRRQITIWRKRRMQLESCNKSLVLLVREKDKRINELLLQTARMNEVLLARRRAPIIHIK